MIILNGIVKNEASRVERLFDSVPWIHKAVFVDTGSTDGTQELLKRRGAHVVQSDWQGFGKARTEALEALRVWGARDQDWVLFLDLDQVWEGRALHDPGTVMMGENSEEIPPDVDRVDVIVQCGGKRYPLPKLVRFGKCKQWVGRTHEYLEIDSSARSYTLPEVVAVITEVADSVRRTDGVKFVEDEKLLRIDLEEDPKNGRNWFYLGTTLAALGRNGEAVEAYDQCLKHSRWDEEKHLAARYAADNAKRAGLGPRDVFYYYAEATRYCPARPEALSEFAAYLLENHSAFLAMGVAFAAIRAAEKPQRGLFVDIGYRWTAYDVAARATYNAGDAKLAAQFGELAIRFAPKEELDRLRENQEWYLGNR